jgi:hypothetical protein
MCALFILQEGAVRFGVIDQDQIVHRKAKAARPIDQAVPDVGR